MAHVQGSTASPVDKVGPTTVATPLSSTSRDLSEIPVDVEDEGPADRASVLQKDAAVIAPSATITAATRKPNDIPGGDPTIGQLHDTTNEKDEHIAVDPAYAVNSENTSAEVVAAKESDDEVEVQDDRDYPNGFTLGTLTFGLCLATFVIALDNTIIATAIPKITTVFNSLNDVGWYGSSYLLTTTSLQPSLGKVYTYFNIKWTYIGAIVVFEIGSLVCALAQNSVMLIVGRAIAGAGAAGLFSGGMTIIGYTVPLKKRPIYIAMLSSMFGIFCPVESEIK
ncbi:hypothetical protein MMC26_006307 [Xylographa opegraphella]|nr:hypothetical protein [Xylographa opegraphella]